MAKPNKKEASKTPSKTPEKKRAYLSQSDVPVHGLEEAIRVAQALMEYAGGPVTPLQLATALNIPPTIRAFSDLCGSAIAYGLTSGGSKAESISLEPLGKRIVQPTQEGDDVAAKREAILRPRVTREFLKKYQNVSLPRNDIARNVLVDLGVPRERAESVYTQILDSAQSVGFIREIQGKQFVDINGVAVPTTPKADGSEAAPLSPPPAPSLSLPKENPITSLSGAIATPSAARDGISRRVFITHGKNKAFIEPIKKLLGFGEMIPVVAVEKQTVSKPVPDKVMDDMRSCGAAIIHVDEELRFIDGEAKEHVLVNQNVLIEIGAAMALYGRRYILLVKDGVRLPSNLQGLYEVRYKSDALDGDTTIRLLEAINDIKNNPMPPRYIEGNDSGSKDPA